MKTYIVIPAFNEENSIAQVIKGLKRHGYKNIVVVDDGSTDKTFQKAKAAKVQVLRHFINRGQGAALKTGIDYALSQGADIIVTFDADGQHNPAEIKNLIRPVKEGKTDVALGSRFLKKGVKVPVVRKVFLKGGIVFTRVFSGIRLTDAHNGFRAFDRKAAQKIEIKHDGMAHSSEIVDEIYTKKLRYKEVPVTITYTDYSKRRGQSNLNSSNIAFKYLIRKLSK